MTNSMKVKRVCHKPWCSRHFPRSVLIYGQTYCEETLVMGRVFGVFVDIAITTTVLLKRIRNRKKTELEHTKKRHLM